MNETVRKAEASPSASATTATTAAPSPVAPAAASYEKKMSRRRILLLVGPLVVVIGGAWTYLSGGRYIATDNAYVKADKVNLAADVAGFVSDVLVKEGDKVTRGQPLVKLDDSLFRIALNSATAQLDLARNQTETLQATYRTNEAQITQARTDLDFYKTSYDRQRDLVGRGFASQSAFDQAKRDFDAARDRLAISERQAVATLAQLGGNPDLPVDQQPSVRSAQAQVDRARRDLDHAVLVAPATGIVTNVASVQKGQYLSVAQAALSFVSLENVWVEANPKEGDLTYLKPGDTATITVDTFPGHEMVARVSSISPATGSEFSVLPAQNATGNWVKVVQRVPVRLQIADAAAIPLLRSGMSASVTIDTGHQRSLASLGADLKHMLGL